MALWEYKVISSGKGGFATPALLESYLNQLGTEDWEIIEFRTQPENPLAFSGLARRPTQRDWTLEAAAAAAAKVEADKLRAEFAAKFQAATKTDAQVKAEEGGAPVRDDSFRAPRDTEYDQDPYALDDSSPEEPEEIPEEDQLPTFFEAVRPHMRRNQKGPGYSVGIEYLLKKFEMIEDDLVNALKEVGFAMPEDEDDKPVYVEYDGDIYWVNTNRRGELWLNTREKPRQVFKVVKGNRLTPEQEAEHKAAEQEAQGQNQNQHQNQKQNRRNERNERNDRNERNEQRRRQEPEQAQQASEAAPATEAAPDQAAAGTEAAPQGEASAEKPAKQEAAPVPLPEGTALVERLRPMMRRSRGGWSGTISYLSRALRHSEADLVAALATIGLVPPATGGEKAPVIEVGAFAYWLNKDGRGGIWINVREARRMKSEGRQEGSASAEAAAPGEASAPVAGETPASPEASESVAAPVEAASAPVAEAIQAPVSEQATPAVVEAAPAAPVVEAPVAPAAESSPVPAPEPAPATLPLAGARLLMRELKPGSFSGEICDLSSQLGKDPESFVEVLVRTGLKVPEKPRERPVFVEHAGEVFWLNRNAKGELWLNAKASKYSRRDDEDEEGEESEEESAPGTEEKKPRRAPRSRKKPAAGEEPAPQA